MDWKIPVLAIAIVNFALSTPSLFAQDTGSAQDTQQRQETQEAPESEQAQDVREAPETEERDNNQIFVIGLGFGGHTFATPHNAGGDDATLQVISAFMQQIYGEWYVFDKVGFGLRLITFGTSASSSTSVTIGNTTTVTSSEVELNVNNLLFTVNWVPLGGQRYARLGLLAGLGISDYEFTETNSLEGTETSTTSGTAALLGIYLDWGADGFGARFGTQYLSTELDPIDGSSIDASGRDIYIDLRWAF